MTYGVSDVLPDPLWRYARRVSRITYAYRGLPALAFAFHGWQRGVVGDIRCLTGIESLMGLVLIT